MPSALLILTGCAAPGTHLRMVDEELSLTETRASDDESKQRGGFFDHRDGQLDLGALLLTGGGALPFPILFNEPAVGVGFGAGVAFFHGAEEFDNPWDVEPAEAPPPGVTALFAAGTTNESWLAGIHHQGSYRGDQIRYTGQLVPISMNLDFFVGDAGFQYQSDGVWFLQELLHRVGERDFFLGADYTLLETESAFELGEDVGLRPDNIEVTLAGLGLVGLVDTRDNIFSPTRGQEIKVVPKRFDGVFGSGADYWQLAIDAKTYHTLHPDVVVAARLSGKSTDGEVPFFALPDVQLRGVPRVRYQGDDALSCELEVSWTFIPRWSAVAFAGAGAAWSDDFPDSRSIVAGGVGGRYRIARPLGLDAGFDLARGPEESVHYVVIGSNL